MFDEYLSERQIAKEELWWLVDEEEGESCMYDSSYERYQKEWN